MQAANVSAARPGSFRPGDDARALQDFYAANGYLVIEGAFAADEVQQLLAEATAICRGERGPLEGAPTELPPNLSEAELLRRFLCIHFPHKFSALMRQTLFNPATLQALTAVIGPNVKCMQSMLFLKAAGEPGQAWHQDEDYIPTRDRSLTGAWIALERATIENGCLWVIPGSHRHGVLWDQHWHADRRFDCSEESRGFPYTDADAVPVEVEAGSVVIFNGYLLHRSLPNRSTQGQFRRALVNHFMSAESLLPWKFKPGTPMALQDYRDIVLVAGQDPYAHRGTVDIARPHLRTDGRSGCVSWVVQGQRHRYADERSESPESDA